MKVSYKDVKGELVKLEKNTTSRTIIVGNETIPCFCGEAHDNSLHQAKILPVYDLSIYDEDKKATVSFEAIDPRDIRFIGASVTIQ